METPRAAQQAHKQMSCSPSANLSLSQREKKMKKIWKRMKKRWTLRFKKLQFRPSLCLLQCLLPLALPTVNWLSILCAVAGKAGVNKLIFSWKGCSITHPYQLPHQCWQIPSSWCTELTTPLSILYIKSRVLQFLLLNTSSYLPFLSTPAALSFGGHPLTTQSFYRDFPLCRATLQENAWSPPEECGSAQLEGNKCHTWLSKISY